MNSTVYLKIALSSKVHKKDVTVGDVAHVLSEDKTLVNKIKTLKIYKFKNEKDNRIVFSSLKVIELILNEYQGLEINHIGEPDFLLEYEPLNKRKLIPPSVIAALCCVLIFFGAAFTIMTFNSEATIGELFVKIYEDLTGKSHDGVTALEISYSIGIGLGIIIFYNHFGKRKITTDPTPLELEMRKYETEIETALIDGAKKKEDHIDVS